MARKASKKALLQLQKFFDLLGKYGGTIETKNPGTWWKLTLEVQSMEDHYKDIIIGVCKWVGDDMFGDLLYDPLFSLTLQIDDEGKIIGGEIKNCINQTNLGTTEIDGDDYIYGCGIKERAFPGLRKKFSIFMDNIANIGPYLTDPKEIKRYEERGKP